MAQPFLSPMFGSLEKEEKKAKEPISDVNYACLEKPRSSYLGTVLSPIYGYESITNVQKETKKVDNSKKVATDVTSDLADIFSSVDFNEKKIWIRQLKSICLMNYIRQRTKICFISLV